MISSVEFVAFAPQQANNIDPVHLRRPRGAPMLENRPQRAPKPVEQEVDIRKSDSASRLACKPNDLNSVWIVPLHMPLLYIQSVSNRFRIRIASKRTERFQVRSVVPPRNILYAQAEQQDFRFDGSLQHELKLHYASADSRVLFVPVFFFFWMCVLICQKLMPRMDMHRCSPTRWYFQLFKK